MKLKIDDTVIIRIGRETLGWGIVTEVTPEDVYVALEGNDQNIVPYSHSHVQRKRRDMQPGDGRATKAVAHNLLDKDAAFRTPVYERLVYTDLESFTASAKRWLGDKSELSRKTIDCADWEKVYQECKDHNKP